MDTLPISLAYNDVIDHVPMFRPGVHPSDLVSHSEKGVCDASTLFGAHAEKEETIVIDSVHPMRPKNILLAAIFSYAGIGVT